MCPMCCGETFTNPESLKYHLLQMTDNLYCPGCSIRTYSIAALIQHLDCCGKEVEDEKIQSKKGIEFVDKLEDMQDLNEEDVDDILMVMAYCFSF